jgi:flagella basal body P-ring formation protein FlgA
MTARQSIFTILAVVFLLYGMPAPAAVPASLRANVLIDGNSIRLGDIFNGAGTHAEKIIAYAPAPGRKLVLEATWLFRVARAFRVNWRPSSRLDRAVVERRSQIIDTSRIIEIVLSALKENANLNDDVEIELDHQALRLFLPTNIPPTIKTRSISYEPRSGRFSAVLSTLENSAGTKQFSVTGNAHKIVQVPILAQRLYTDDIIGKRDIVWKSMRISRLDPRTVLNSEKLIGMSPRRPIVAGRPIVTTEIQPPTLVRRGKRVTILLNTAHMRLTTLGKSLENGGKGDVVRIQNIDSGATIEATVIGPERVRFLHFKIVALMIPTGLTVMGKYMVLHTLLIVFTSRF